MIAGPPAWALAVAAAAASALALEVAAPDETPRARAARGFVLLAFGAAAAWAATLAPEGGRAPWAAVAWWLLAIPAMALGAARGGSETPRALARLVAGQAVPAVLLGLAPSLRLPALGWVGAGLARSAAPPLHPLHLAAAEALSLGGLTLSLSVGLAVGAPLAVRATLALGEGQRSWLALALAAAAAVAGLASAVDRNLLRRLAAWASVQAGVAVAVLAISDDAAWRDPGKVALAHLGACAVALAALAFVLGRVVALVRVSDLGAHGGLLPSAMLRAQAVIAVTLVAMVASARAPLALARALGDAAALPRLAAGLALAGWFGASLGLVLAAMRITRGQRSAPGAAVPELRLLEALFVAALLVFAVMAAIDPNAWAAAK